jgi:HPt (histidine-containing phosphotransfer) domain-containing protein
MVGDRERCLQAGMNDHLTKPIVPQRLYEMIERWGLGAVSGGVVRDTAGVTATERERFRVLQPAIDVDQAWRNINGRGALLETMLLEFVRRFDGVADRMREELARQALDEMQRQAHTLKGVAATLGANAVATVSGRIETILRQRPGDMVPDQLDGPDGPDVTMWEPLLSELAREMALVRDRVADWQQKATPVDPDPGATASAGRTGTLDRAALMPLLREIDRMLNDGDATVTDRLPALERCLRSWCPPEDILMQALRQVCDHAANFDFDEAVIVFADVTAALEERPA